MAKGCALSTGYLHRESLPRNSVDRITDRPDMTSAVDSGRKASTQTQIETHIRTVFRDKMKVVFGLLHCIIENTYLDASKSVIGGCYL